VNAPASVEGRLAFARPADVGPDDRGTDLLRAKIHDLDAPVDARTFDVRPCRVRDCSALEDFSPGLIEHGFSHVDLEPLERLQQVLEGVRARAELCDEDVARIRRELGGASLPLGRGRRLRILHIAREGFFMRRAWPNGMKLGEGADGHHHEPARAVHIDQDVDGTPLRQLLRGTAPWLFHHDSPAHANRRSPLHVLNLWIPLDQVTAPLALLDRSTLDRRTHQARYGLPTDTFLERSEDRSVNDIWTLLYDGSQDWYFTSDMDARRAYVFETLSTAHGAFVLPGEDRVEQAYRAIEATIEAIEAGDAAGAAAASELDAEAELPAEATATLRRAVSTMRDLLASGHEQSEALAAGDGAQAWIARARAANNRVVRKSIEMRVVGVVVPDLWPLRWL
jgi:hypothetical protein